MVRSQISGVSESSGVEPMCLCRLMSGRSWNRTCRSASLLVIRPSTRPGCSTTPRPRSSSSQSELSLTNESFLVCLLHHLHSISPIALPLAFLLPHSLFLSLTTITTPSLIHFLLHLHLLDPTESPSQPQQQPCTQLPCWREQQPSVACWTTQ